MSSHDEALQKVKMLESEFPSLKLAPDERTKLARSLAQLLSMLKELDNMELPEVPRYVLFRR